MAHYALRRVSVQTNLQNDTLVVVVVVVVVVDL